MGPVCLDKSRPPASDTAGALCGDRDDAKYPCDEARLWARYRGVLETQYVRSHSSWLGLISMGPLCLDKRRTPASDTAGLFVVTEMTRSTRVTRHAFGHGIGVFSKRNTWIVILLG